MKVRGVLIDPEKRTVEEVQVNIPNPDEGGAESIREHIKADLFDMVRLGDHAALWVDDNGLVNPPPHHLFAMPAFYRLPLCGRGLITGMRGSETIGIEVPVSVVEASVMWLDAEFTGFEETVEDDVEIMPGIRGQRRTRTPTFRRKGDA
jgi:hypothetical protein